MSGETAGSVLERLGATSREVQRLACEEAAEQLRRDPTFRDPLVRLLRSGSRRARFGAAFALFQVRPSLLLLPALLDALELDDGDLRWAAVRMLATLGHRSGEVYPLLLHELQSGDSPVRRRMAIYALRELGPEREETEAGFLEALADPNPEVRRAALSSMGKLAASTPACLERVLEVLAGDRDGRMRRMAAVLTPDLARRHPQLVGRVQAALGAAAGGDDRALADAAQIALRRLGDGTAP